MTIKVCNFEKNDEALILSNEEKYLSTDTARLDNKWTYDIETENFLRDLPKVELHVHLDGSFDADLLYEYITTYKEKVYNRLPEEANCPWDDSKIPIRSAIEECQNSQDLHTLCACRGKRSLHEMIKCFEHFIPIVRGDLDLIETIAFDFVKRQAAQNIIYTEVRYSPHLLAEGGDFAGDVKVDALPVLNAVTKGLRRGEKEYPGIKVNQILCCIAWRPDWADDVINLANDMRDNFPCAVVGVDIAAGEEHFDKVNYPQLDHEGAFQRAKQLGLNITIHAGEVGTTENVEKSVKDYGATRIGHGYRIGTNKPFMDEMKRLKIHFEACPTSSLETGGWEFASEAEKDWKMHPSIKMLENGLSVGLNSDDPAVFDTSLTWQYRIAVGKMGLSRKDICQSIHASISAAFIKDDEKQQLGKAVDEYIARHEA